MTVKLNDDQAKALGLGDLIPKRASLAPDDGMNKLERKYAGWLEELRRGGQVRDYRFESVRFRLAKKTWLLPDFYVVRPDGSCECHECKGNHFRDDAKVKIKVAAEMYPHLRWYVVRWVDSGWDFERVEGRKTP